MILKPQAKVCRLLLWSSLTPLSLKPLWMKPCASSSAPITGDGVGITVKIGGGRVYVGIDCDEDSGLLIGREGQTLAALQYMISRIVSRGMNAAVRVQLDAGEYRRRQDEKLREMALAPCRQGAPERALLLHKAAFFVPSAYCARVPARGC